MKQMILKLKILSTELKFKCEIPKTVLLVMLIFRLFPHVQKKLIKAIRHILNINMTLMEDKNEQGKK